ncbi:serine/threonine kinase 16 [Exophiala viscosa]|uniref:serine/threonine kinase 16 n=1 Tax=Exophiala viscosa TaxID=2486360 RepID=UPI00219BF1A2|nr:serine/threonine kinase 16 [Exophiala viscosa]
MPFLGILDDKKIPHVPGTVILEETAAHSESLTGGLKHGTGRNHNIVLVPQPSNDPNDPLNWPMSKKLRALGITCFGSILYAAVTSAMLNAAFATIAVEVNTTISALVLATGYQTLVVGVTGPMFSALARKWGKRPVFLLASIFCLAADLVGSCVNSYQGILTSRVLQGFAIAPYESLVFTLISDMFFVHERGLYASCINFILAGISNLTGVVAGPIANNLGWKWLYYLLVLFGGIQLILQFFLVPETSYNRDHRYDIDEIKNDNLEDLVALEYQEKLNMEKLGATHAEDGTPVTQATSRDVPIHTYKKKTYVQELAIFSGTYSNENLLQLFMAPFAVVLNLAVAWILLINSMFVVLYVVIAFVLSQLFAYPPYLLSVSAIGYLSFGPFIGGVLGSVILGVLFDPWIKWCARRNRGIYEPEYRLVPVFLGALSGVGLMLFGKLVSIGASPYATATVHGLMLFGVMFTCIGTSSYALDAYRGMANEIFIASMAVKNIILFGFSYFVNDWTAKVGPAHAFYVWGAVAFALIATVPFAFFFGKKYRSWWARHALLEKMHVTTHEE